MGDFDNKNIYFDGYMTMKKWLENRNQGRTFVDYFKECGYNTIAICEITDIGKLLYDEIKDSDINIAFFVDRNAEGLKEIDDIPVVMIQDLEEMQKNNPIDILVISPVIDYNKITRSLAYFAPEIPTLYIKDAVYEF